MAKIAPSKPFLILFYGFPGAGKTYFARQFCERVQAAHIQADRIRHELFEKPRYDKEENQVVLQIVDYMLGEFLQVGVSVVYDLNAMRFSQRRQLRSFAVKVGAEPVLVWQQIDPESAFNRAIKRDKRKADDKYAYRPDWTTFQKIASAMQNPTNAEEYLVTSGKHVFNTQFNTVMRHMYRQGIIHANDVSSRVVKPGLINLIPNPQAGRVDMTRRNINVR